MEAEEDAVSNSADDDEDESIVSSLASFSPLELMSFDWASRSGLFDGRLSMDEWRAMESSSRNDDDVDVDDDEDEADDEDDDDGNALDE